MTHTDQQKRQLSRTRSGGLSGSPFEKSGGLLDLGKVAKLIIDACCTRQV
jgi:hypothetical protein